MKKSNWIAAGVLVLGLIAVRILEDRLFYDPFLDYFKHKTGFPQYDFTKLLLSHLYRFGLNLVLSAGIIEAIFRNRNWTIQAVILMVLCFAVALPMYLYCVKNHFEYGELFAFYLRRFVIQPIILLLIIPIFYYRKNLEKIS